ncbi:uncharacterized protein LOC18421966 [Amborella trichopoda]|nr:uncharacterized protein LOC18421966 [Amborella trichopoda]|eukprot:XP_020520771.1 uncharacterized protein LOC18421966 [Amborella trichopoda]
MGCSNSRMEEGEGLMLCKERKRFIKQAVDRRYALASVHVCYLQSMRSMGVALRRFAEAEVLTEPSISASATEKSPSHCSYPSPSPSQHAEITDSALHHESPLSPPTTFSTLNYMKSGVNSSVTYEQRPPRIEKVAISSPPRSPIFREDQSEEAELNASPASPSMAFLRPPPLPRLDSSWDFFDPWNSDTQFDFSGEKIFSLNRKFDDLESPKRARQDGRETHLEGVDREILKGKDGVSIGSSGRGFCEDSISPVSYKQRIMLSNAHSFAGFPSERFVDEEGSSQYEERESGGAKTPDTDLEGENEGLARVTPCELGGSKRENRVAEKEASPLKEDAAAYITHRAKDFLSSVKDIENRFFRASESGKEVSRMLEANKIRPTSTDMKGTSHASMLLSACCFVCFTGQSQTALAPQDPPQLVPKVITWNRSTSSRSSSSKNPLASASKDDMDDSSSDFVDDFCMISGSHSSTLDRLYAWERKLYDEVKASEIIRKDYEKKCNQLKHQFAKDKHQFTKDLKPLLIDKTRAVVKDLHSRLRVAIHSVDSISKRIEKLRDEELQPQLLELIQGLIRMWRAMLECHHLQHITISLAYHTRISAVAARTESQKQASACLENELNSLSSSFSDWVNAQKSYVEALKGWLFLCILPPRENSSSRRRNQYLFSPCRELAPPIFALCRDWLSAFETLPIAEVPNAIKSLVAEVQHHQNRLLNDSTEGSEEKETESEKVPEQTLHSNLKDLQAGLTQVFDCLRNFSEALVKMYEDISQKCERARVAYTSGRRRAAC